MSLVFLSSTSQTIMRFILKVRQCFTTLVPAIILCKHSKHNVHMSILAETAMIGLLSMNTNDISFLAHPSPRPQLTSGEREGLAQKTNAVPTFSTAMALNFTCHLLYSTNNEGKAGILQCLCQYLPRRFTRLLDPSSEYSK